MTALVRWFTGAERAITLVALAGALICAAAASASPRLALYAPLALVAVLVVFNSLLTGLALFIVLTFPEALPGTLGVGPTLAKPLGVVLLLSWVLVLIADRERTTPFLPRDAPILTGALLAFLVWSLASVAWAADRTATLHNVTRLVQLVGLVFVAYSAVRRHSDMLVLFGAVLVGGALTCGYALANGTVAHGRLTGSIFNPNALATEVVVAMSIAAFLLVGTRRLWLRVVLIGLLLLFTAVLAQTQSRSGVLALGVAAVTAVIVAGPLRARVLAMVLIACTFAVGYYVYAAPQQLRDRITSIGSGTSQSSAGRTDTWQIALRMSGDHPIAGVGLGNFPARELDYVAGTLNLVDITAVRQYQLVVHNSYLEILAELGVVGLALFSAVLWLSVGRVTAVVLRHGRDASAALLDARALTTATIALLTTQIFGSGEYSKQLWLLLGMSVAAAAHAAHPVRQPTVYRQRDARLVGVSAV